MASPENPLVAVVTGASQGVGRAVARELGAHRAHVALVARNIDGLAGAAEEINAAGGEALVLPLDVSDASAVDAAADAVVERWGKIDVWINNAMVSVFSPVAWMTADEFRRVTEVTYLGYVYGTCAALRHMRKRDSGMIIQIGSALAYRSIPLQSAYCAAKAAIRGFTDSLRCELLHDKSNIKITMLQLPAVNTPQFDVVRNKLGEHGQPVPPIFQPELIAHAVMHAIEHPTREMWIGWPTLKAIVAQRLAPGIADHYLASHGYASQVTTALPPTRSDNLYAPLPGDRGAHGDFDHRAKDFSAELWLRLHRGAIAAAALGLLATALLARRWR
ncbi:MAG TPA: SDR family oxidoreductase [Kofleriaceae bacterium]|nr:SDR family oxidoreductase [Kofleriaceae bacterium]